MPTKAQRLEAVSSHAVEHLENSDGEGINAHETTDTEVTH
jgi:hypothetical protein